MGGLVVQREPWKFSSPVMARLFVCMIKKKPGFTKDFFSPTELTFSYTISECELVNQVQKAFSVFLRTEENGHLF